MFNNSANLFLENTKISKSLARLIKKKLQIRLEIGNSMSVKKCK